MNDTYSSLLFLFYCIIVFFVTIFFSILLDIVFKNIQKKYVYSEYYETFFIWLLIVLYIYILKEILYYLHNNLFLNDYVTKFLYNIDSENITNTVSNDIKEHSKYDILLICSAVVPLIIINQEILRNDLNIIYNHIKPSN